jgi:hypothetical protein
LLFRPYSGEKYPYVNKKRDNSGCGGKSAALPIFPHMTHLPRSSSLRYYSKYYNLCNLDFFVYSRRKAALYFIGIKRSIFSPNGRRGSITFILHGKGGAAARPDG